MYDDGRAIRIREDLDGFHASNASGFSRCGGRTRSSRGLLPGPRLPGELTPRIVLEQEGDELVRQGVVAELVSLDFGDLP